MTLLPYQQDREYESTLGEHRVSQGMTIKELCEKADIHISTYTSLNSGMTSPIYLLGKKYSKPKPSVERLAHCLNVDFEDLFPRYFCRVGINDLTNEQVLFFSISTEKEGTEKFIQYDFIDSVLSKIKLRDRFLIIWRYLYDYTYEEIGEAWGLSKERIRQKIMKALRTIRCKTHENSV